MFESKLPKLIKLTQIKNPDFSDIPDAQNVFVQPLHISFIGHGRGSFIKEDAAAHQTHPRVDCTIITMMNGHQIMVEELTDVVASMHERALLEIAEH